MGISISTVLLSALFHSVTAVSSTLVAGNEVVPTFIPYQCHLSHDDSHLLDSIHACMHPFILAILIYLEVPTHSLFFCHTTYYIVLLRYYYVLGIRIL